MLGLIATIVAACVAAGILSTALAGEPHWAKEEGFGLAVIGEQEQEQYVVTTFIPRSLLLYDVDPEGPPALGKGYASATTLDGVRVYMLKENISSKTFSKGRGRHELIFHAPATLCKIVQCDKSDDTQVWRISAGEAFKIVDTLPIPAAEIYTLVSHRHGEEIRAFLPHSILNDLIAKRIVTRSDFDHPKYDISRTDSAAANTKCGVPISKELTLPSLSPTDKLVIGKFELGEVGSQFGNTIINFTKDYGGEQEAFRFFVYHVEERANGEKFKIVAAVVYECRRESFFNEKMLRIKHVELLVLGQRQNSYLLEAFKTPSGLIDFTKAPYLWSVNNYAQYLQLIERVSEKLHSPSLAGFFISEYNRSCPSDLRSDPRCSGHSYRE